MNKYEKELYLANRYDCFFYWGEDEYFKEKNKQARKQYNEDVSNGLCEKYD